MGGLISFCCALARGRDRKVGVNGRGGLRAEGRGCEGADPMGSLRRARIQWENSAEAAGLLKMLRAEGASGIQLSSRIFSAEGLPTGFL